jgi:hypothetical protein
MTIRPLAASIDRLRPASAHLAYPRDSQGHNGDVAAMTKALSGLLGCQRSRTCVFLSASGNLDIKGPQQLDADVDYLVSSEA